MLRARIEDKKHGKSSKGVTGKNFEEPLSPLLTRCVGNPRGKRQEARAALSGARLLVWMSLGVKLIYHMFWLRNVYFNIAASLYALSVGPR